MQRELMDMQMNFLLSRVGSEVRCVYWERGECMEVAGKLSAVYPYDRIIVGDKIVPFVSSSTAVEKVDISGKEIYLCSKAQGYQGCSGLDQFGVGALQKELLGRSVILEKLIGLEAHCVYWERGERKEARGNIGAIYPFDRISVGGKPIPFASNSIAIESVDIAGKKVYLCLKAKGYQGCFGSDRFEIVKNQLDLLGRSVELDKLNKAYDNAPYDAKPHIIEGGRGFGK